VTIFIFYINIKTLKIMYLLMYSGNWDDEIIVDGFIIIDNNKKNSIINLLENYDETIYINNGDDEIEYENGKELLDEISIEKITKEEFKVIERFFGEFNDFGYNLLSNINKIDNNLE